MNDEESQKLYQEFIQLQQQAEQLQEHVHNIQEQLKNISQTRQTIKHLQELKSPAASWVQVAPGAYVKATTNPADTLLLNIGSNVAVEKTPEQVLKTLEEHATALEQLSEAAFRELQEVLGKIQKIKEQVDKV